MFLDVGHHDIDKSIDRHSKEREGSHHLNDDLLSSLRCHYVSNYRYFRPSTA